MKNPTDFCKTVETGVDPRLDWMIYLKCVVRGQLFSVSKMNIKASKTCTDTEMQFRGGYAQHYSIVMRTRYNTCR